MASHFVYTVLSVQGFVLLIRHFCLLVWRKNVLHQRHQRKRLSTRWVLFGYLPWFRDFNIKSREKVSCSVDWSSNVCYFEVELLYIITCIPECWWNCLCLEEACDGLVVCQDNCWLCCFPQSVCKLEKCNIYCQIFFWVYGHFKLCGGESFWAKCHGGVRFPLWLYFLIRIFFDYEGISSNPAAGIRH